jgi:non-ribosomal peptide synthetase component E (peptide arylation enzyme)
MSSFLKEKGLAIHKHPERLEVIEEFPQLVDGQKVDKMSLKRIIMEKRTPTMKEGAEVPRENKE